MTPSPSAAPEPPVHLATLRRDEHAVERRRVRGAEPGRVGLLRPGPAQPRRATAAAARRCQLRAPAPPRPPTRRSRRAGRGWPSSSPTPSRRRARASRARRRSARSMARTVVGWLLVCPWPIGRARSCSAYACWSAGRKSARGVIAIAAPTGSATACSWGGPGDPTPRVCRSGPGRGATPGQPKRGKRSASAPRTARSAAASGSRPVPLSTASARPHAGGRSRPSRPVSTSRTSP